MLHRLILVFESVRPYVVLVSYSFLDSFSRCKISSTIWSIASCGNHLSMSRIDSSRTIFFMILSFLSFLRKVRGSNPRATFLPPNDLANRPLHHLSNLPEYHVASVMICRHHLQTFVSSAVPGTFTRFVQSSTLEPGCNYLSNTVRDLILPDTDAIMLITVSILSGVASSDRNSHSLVKTRE